MKQKLLIVDDLPDNIKLLANVLSNEGYYIEFATSGNEALECLRAESFDLILLDVMMPGINGFETCKIIKNDPQFVEVPVIFLTAITDIASIKEGFEVGGIDYITKPFNPEELLIRINTQLELRANREALKDLNKTLERNVQERTKQLEETLGKLTLANEELTKLDDAKNNFLKIVSHELRTPLNSILGFTELIRENPEAEDLPMLLNGLTRAAWRLEKLSYTALHITKLNINTDIIDVEKVSLLNLTKSVITSLKNSGGNMICTFNYTGIDKDIYVTGDKNLLQQCIYNLLENANHYGTVCIIEADYNSNGEVIYSIEDDGIGFSESILKNPFKLFSTGHTYINKNAGLGLALSKLIMDAHHSKIELGNKSAGGALIKLIFSKHPQEV